jgi:hypothetical protein
MPNYLALISLSSLWKAAVYVVGVVLFVLLSLELLLRLTFPDPSYYWPFRFLYISPHAFQNRTEAVWTYQPNTSIREVAVYGVPSLFRERPRMIIEYDCTMKSNNLGFLQERDIGTDEMSTVVIGDSFTEGQGGCPWVDRLQARRPDDPILNAGLMGTGFAQWVRVLEFLQQQGVKIERILAIAISNDFKRGKFNWTGTALDCFDRDDCPSDDAVVWKTVGLNDTHSELESRTRVRFTERFGRTNMRLYFHLNSHLYKFVSIARERLSAIVGGAGTDEAAGVLPDTEAALDWLKAQQVPVHVLMVPQRDEVGWLGAHVDTQNAEAALKAHHMPYSWCDLSESDFMPYDGHPNRGGYDKLAECADHILRVMK